METKLPSGNLLFESDTNPNALKVILYFSGLSFGIEIIEANECTPGTDAWNNRQIEIYQEIKKYS